MGTPHPPSDDAQSSRAAIWQRISIRRINVLLLIVVLLLLPLIAGELVRRVRFYWTGAVVVQGSTFYLQPDDTYLTQYVLDWGCYEPTETQLFRSKIQPGDTVIDVGANVGWFTVIASKLVGEKGRVFAFEPDPTSFGYLQRNVEVNGCKNVILEQKALSNEEGKVELFIATEHLGLHRIYDFEDGRKSVTVDAVRLDDYLDGLVSSVEVIKIDTEGAEGVIVEGMNKTLSGNRDVKLFMEFSPDNLRQSDYDPSKLLHQCISHGFEFHGISEARERVFPIRDEQELLREQSADPTLLNLYMQRASSDVSEL